MSFLIYLQAVIIMGVSGFRSGLGPGAVWPGPSRLITYLLGTYQTACTSSWLAWMAGCEHLDLASRGRSKCDDVALCPQTMVALCSTFVSGGLLATRQRWGAEACSPAP